jgi:2-amino-4-hydroxy-6-hydroxymethyldihydropteridine diphosphokinase
MPGVLTYIGLGANLGDARATLLAAVDAISTLSGTGALRVSSIYRTEPIDASGPDYLNAVIELATPLSAHSLLTELQRIETEHGRVRPYPNAPRTLDLDLLLYGNECIVSATLEVPHPRLHQRAFVLVPLSELAPGLSVPGQGPLPALLAAVKHQRIDKLPV